ncbi:hypothetical protein FFLO_05326 [Filobasidium floriforme]|uniref:cystathionine beta-synthase n=1 Tax=Filobasidium floriforme TaxID=5210 RepID=A0A8K0JIF6_9TREE|nr:hypothetical protein FFLO_05326 [Filobasidium floriforme]
MDTKHHWSGVLDSAADAVGHTPLINLRRLAQTWGIKCNILAKVEFFSAGGSIKDRIALRMITHAERSGLLIPGYSVIIEPTSGNTGIGLALLAGLKGYRCIITLPAKMSKEKEAVLRSLGAEVVRTPTEAGWDDETSHIQIAKRLAKEIPGGIILDQYNNIQNPLAHYYSTFGEIQQAIHPQKIHALIAGAGTGGTITGLSRALRDSERDRWPLSEEEAEREVRKVVSEFDKEKDLLMDSERGSGSGSEGEGEVVERSLDAQDVQSSHDQTINGNSYGRHESSPKADEGEVGLMNKLGRGEGIVVGVDPLGSILGGGEVGQYVIEGIGYDFFPEVLDPSSKCIDKWIKTTDEEAYEMVRTVMRTESLLIGGSSGSALAGLFKFLTQTCAGKELAQTEGKNVVVILPDGIRNYISKSWFLDPVLGAPPSDLGQSIEKVLGRKMGDAYHDQPGHGEAESAVKQV